MTELDTMLAEFVIKSMEKNLGKKTTKRIENELQEWYQVDLKNAITQFDKLDRVLANIYGKKAARALEKKFTVPIVDQTKTNAKDTITLTLNDRTLSQQLFDVLKDDINRKILQILRDTPLPIFELVRHEFFERYSDKTIYQKMWQLSKMGLITITGYTQSPDNKRVKIYGSILESTSMQIDGQDILVSITIPKKIAESSTIFASVFS